MSKMREVLESADYAREEDRSLVSLEAGRILNTSPGYRPSDAAREAVRRYQESPERFRAEFEATRREWIR